MTVQQACEYLMGQDEILILCHQSPDGDTLGRFRHILEENGIQQKLFAQVVRRLMEKIIK